jgi:hypothetical protein
MPERRARREPSAAKGRDARSVRSSRMSSRLILHPLPGAAHFAAPVCRNCDAPLGTPFCGQCGQKKAARLGRRAIGSEIWQNWRLFEISVLKAAWNVLRWPGCVAREYVLGARTRHLHPLKLLLLAIGALLLVLSQSNYLDIVALSDKEGSGELVRSMALVRSYANWSFSLTIVAIAASSLLCFGRGRGFNPVEHLVLAVYCHFLVICASVLIKLPTLVWRDPAFLALHKVASTWGMDVIGALILTFAFKQFFLLDLRRELWRLLLAVAVFVFVKWSLTRLYAQALVSWLLG